jgi:competence protein ComEA
MNRILAWATLLPASVGLAFATVNVNTAQQSELQRVKGLDKYSAKQIIEYRAQNGDFHTLEDLGKLLSQDTVEKVKPELAVSGDAYVPPPKPAKKPKKGNRE